MRLNKLQKLKLEKIMRECNQKRIFLSKFGTPNTLLIGSDKFYMGSLLAAPTAEKE